ncbi:MAG: hypothetical protein IK024_12460 [Treponema sp.]|nr:hypothetical protein [Treponema sp.]
MSDNTLQINHALSLTDQLIDCLDDAERQLSSARNWGFIDILGGRVDYRPYKTFKAQECANYNGTCKQHNAAAPAGFGQHQYSG